MRFFSGARDLEPDPLRLCYFHLEALQTSVIQPKFMNEQLVRSLAPTNADIEYASAISGFVDQCSGNAGSPVTAGGRALIVRALEDLRMSVPSSEQDYRFSRHELGTLEVIVISMDK